MENNTNMKIPKKYHPMISNIDHDSDGYWVWISDGYYAGGMGGYDEIHVIHEDTQKEIMEQIRMIKPLNKGDY